MNRVCHAELPGGRDVRGLQAGASLIEVTIALALIAAMSTMAMPTFAATVDAARGRQAAQFVAAQCRGARMEAIAKSSTAALVFERAGGRWRFQRCLDGNSNGVRRADIARGRDVCGAPVDIGREFTGATIDIDASLPDPDGGPGSTDAVRFGASDVASFSSSGTATAGTVYLRSLGGLQYAVRVAGATGRTRVLRFEPHTRSWSEM